MCVIVQLPETYKRLENPLAHKGPAKPIRVLYGPVPGCFQGPGNEAPNEASRTDRSSCPDIRDVNSESDAACARTESRTAARAGAWRGHSMTT